MKIRPADNWFWYFDEDHDRVILDLANGVIFRSSYPAKSLTPDAFESRIFSVEDATLYFQFYESCQQIDESDEFCAELSLNAIVAYHYLKPLMPRSWYFQTQPAFVQPKAGQLVTAQLNESDEKAVLLAIESGESASLCLLAQPQLVLVDKVMRFTDVIKVMNDRLVPYNPAIFLDQNIKKVV